MESRRFLAAMSRWTQCFDSRNCRPDATCCSQWTRVPTNTGSDSARRRSSTDPPSQSSKTIIAGWRTIPKRLIRDGWWSLSRWLASRFNSSITLGEMSRRILTATSTFFLESLIQTPRLTTANVPSPSVSYSLIWNKIRRLLKKRFAKVYRVTGNKRMLVNCTLSRCRLVSLHVYLFWITSIPHFPWHFVDLLSELLDLLLLHSDFLENQKIILISAESDLPAWHGLARVRSDQDVGHWWWIQIC